MPAVSFDDVEENDVVKVSEDMDIWRNCLMLVDEVKSWGVTGTVCCPQDEEYPLRLTWGEIGAVYRKTELTTGG